MPRFLTRATTHDVIPDGIYVFKIVQATERVSENGNEMLVMKLSLPDDRTIPTTITFVEKSRVLVNAFVESCELTKPSGNDVQTELRAEHVRGRYLYAVVVNDVSDPASDPIPKIVRFISREAAILKNPSIADIQLQPQPTVVLPAIRNGGSKL
jgi:hypothetical protein